MLNAIIIHPESLLRCSNFAILRNNFHEPEYRSILRRFCWGVSLGKNLTNVGKELLTLSLFLCFNSSRNSRPQQTATDVPTMSHRIYPHTRTACLYEYVKFLCPMENQFFSMEFKFQYLLFQDIYEFEK